MDGAVRIDSLRTAREISARVTKLLDKPVRTPFEDDEMLHAAHASRHHLGLAGTRLDLIRGEWQCARVYATLRRAEPALHHARRCLALCEGLELDPVDLARAYEVMAYAHAVAGDKEDSRGYERLARRVTTRVDDADQRDLLMADLSATARSRW